jgi:hypothetical protein
LFVAEVAPGDVPNSLRDSPEGGDTVADEANRKSGTGENDLRE